MYVCCRIFTLYYLIIIINNMIRLSDDENGNKEWLVHVCMGV